MIETFKNLLVVAGFGTLVAFVALLPLYAAVAAYPHRKVIRAVTALVDIMFVVLSFMLVRLIGVAPVPFWFFALGIALPLGIVCRIHSDYLVAMVKANGRRRLLKLLHISGWF